jgi:hypothetical protein
MPHKPAGMGGKIKKKIKAKTGNGNNEEVEEALNVDNVNN